MSTGNHAQCPQCNQNDKVERVSAIIASQTYKVEGTRPVTEVYTDSEGKTRSNVSYEKYTNVQISTLAQRLAAPERPQAPNKPFAYWIHIVTIVCAGAALFQVFFHTSMDSGLALLIFIALMIAFPMLYRLSQKAKSDYLKHVSEYQVEIDRYDRAMKRYEMLYYCYRDDCVFVIGETEFVPLSNLREYVYAQ